ncbi:hypothetical protein [Escherichia sp. E1130]|uniref:hypothetical protein n=1 Tax=Escherichia sp. E1130 TaxID=2041645 RepID=UPI0010811A78|nr:hypothetical protein [Escherichia sp. E1130]TGC20909.1 hypothetical protein CQJ27_25745 [Escherichia sp. E1130]
MVDFYEASNDYDRYDSVEHEADFEPVFDAIAGTIDDARDADKGTPLSPDDLNTNIRLALDGLLPRAMEYLKEGKNIEFIDIPDISSLDTEIQEKIPQYLQSKILTHDNELGAPLEKLARILPSFFTCFGEQLPDLDKELAMLKRSRLESGNGKMSTLEIRYHKLRQHASALCQHIPGVFRLLDTVKDNPTHFTPWKLWEDRERTARRIGLSVTADEQKIGLRTIAEFSKKKRAGEKGADG